jgi:hypothetical protein
MRQKQKGAIPIIIVIILAVLALGGGTIYYFGLARAPKKEAKVSQQDGVPSSSATDELSDWQEYNNERYYYKVKYPKDWYFIKEGYSPPPPTSILLSSISVSFPSAGIRYMSAGIDVDKALGRTLENYEEITSLKSQYYQETRLTVGGEPAVKLSVPDPNSAEPIYVYIQHKDYIYRIVWNDLTEEFMQDRKLFEKILISFTFTD